MGHQQQSQPQQRRTARAIQQVKQELANRDQSLIPLIMVLAFATAFLVAQIGSQTAGLIRGEVGDAGVKVDGQMQWAEIAVHFIVLSIPLVFPLVVGHRPEVAGFGVRRLPWPTFVTATALAFMAINAVSLANIFIRHWTGQEQWTGYSTDYEVGTVETAVLAVFAGVTEETTHLAVPVGVTFLIISAIAKWTMDRPMSTGRIWLLAVAIALPLSLFIRFASHTYQGQVSAWLGMVWGAAFLAIFWWTRSIWPIMVAHTLHNMPNLYSTWPEHIAWSFALPLAIAVVAMLYTHRAKKTPAPAHKEASD